jgi:hypothetical protein
VPRRFASLLRFIGFSDSGNTTYCAKIEAAVRTAATGCVWVARSWYRRLPAAPVKPKPSRPVPEALPPVPGDRGCWEGAPANAKLVEIQRKAHEALMQPQREERAEQHRQAVAHQRLEGLRQATGRFTCCTRKHSAGGQVVAASGAGQDLLTQFYRDVDKDGARSWQTLERWWTWSTERATRDAVRFAGLRRLTAGVCRARHDGVRCGAAGVPTAGGRHALCAPCRGSTAPASYVRCDCCGVGADGSGIGNWAAIGRWLMVCQDCVPAVSALPISARCDCCQDAPATRVTADGSNSCADCLDSFSQAKVWLARAQRIVTRAHQRMGVVPRTPALERSLWLHMATRWHHDHGFCGDAVLWKDIVPAIASWWATQGIGLEAAASMDSLTSAADSHPPAWQAAPPRAQPPRQTLLPKHGFTGRQLAVSRPVFRHSRRNRTATPPASPTTPTPSASPRREAPVTTDADPGELSPPLTPPTRPAGRRGARRQSPRGGRRRPPRPSRGHPPSPPGEGPHPPHPEAGSSHARHPRYPRHPRQDNALYEPE